MPDDHLLLEKEDGIATIVINRPQQRNAVTLQMWERLEELMTQLQADARTRVVVIRGAGGKAFASGADIGEMTGLTDRDNHLNHMGRIVRAIETVRTFRYPVIAMVDGFAVGAGCELAVGCDLRVASDKSQFALTAAKLGLMLNYPMTTWLVSLVGAAAAREMLLTGDPVDAQRALQIGLVNRVVPAESLQEETYGLARTIATNAPLSVRGAKLMVARCLAYEEGINHQDLEEIEIRAFASEDAAEGMRAFLERRKPQWRDG